MLKIASSFLAATAALAVTVADPAGTSAQEAYPSRPVTAVVPFAAGGPTDGLARIVAQGLTQRLGQQVLVENVPGAGGTIGSGRTARAEPDGYTLLVGHAGTLAANVGLYKKLPYDAVNDFEPIGFMGDVPQILLVRNDLPVQTAAEFIAYAKEHQNELNCGTAGVGSAAHLGGLLLNAALGTDLQRSSYKGAGPAMNDLMGGQIDCMVDVTTTAVPQIKAGMVRPLAVNALLLATALNPVLGYDNVARITAKALAERTTPREAAIALSLLAAEEYDRLVDAKAMLRPQPRSY